MNHFPVLLQRNWISTPKRQKDDFEALFKRNFKRNAACSRCTHPVLIRIPQFLHKLWIPYVSFFYHTFFCLASHRNCFNFASNTIEATCLYFRSKQNSASFSSREAFTHRSFYTQQASSQRSFHTQQAFTHRTLTHSAFTHGKRLHTQQTF